MHAYFFFAKNYMNKWIVNQFGSWIFVISLAYHKDEIVKVFYFYSFTLSL